MHVHHVGMLRSKASWAKVMRNHLLELKRSGHTVTTRPVEESLYDRSMSLPGPLADLAAEPDDPDVTLTFLPPTEYERIETTAPLVGLLVYEATRWPQQWVDNAKRQLDVASVQSSFCERGLVASGFPEEDVILVPNGYDKSRYYPPETLDHSDTFRPVFVGTPARRKGLDTFLSAIPEAFDPNDDVEVLLKLTPYTDEVATSSHVIQDWRQRYESLYEKGYDIRLCTDFLSGDEIAEFYREGDVLCLPTMGEGFGLTALEAMACGTPPVVTNWSGTTDFVDEDSGFLLTEYERVEASDRFLLNPPPIPDDGYMVSPAVTELAETLQRASDDPGLVRDRGRIASERVEDFRWDVVSSTLETQLHRIVEEMT